MRRAGTIAVPVEEVVTSIPMGFEPGFADFEELTPGVAKVTDAGIGSTTAILSAPEVGTPAVITPSLSIPKGVTTVD